MNLRSTIKVGSALTLLAMPSLGFGLSIFDFVNSDHLKDVIKEASYQPFGLEARRNLVTVVEDYARQKGRVFVGSDRCAISLVTRQTASDPVIYIGISSENSQLAGEFAMVACQEGKRLASGQGKDGSGECVQHLGDDIFAPSTLRRCHSTGALGSTSDGGAVFFYLSAGDDAQGMFNDGAYVDFIRLHDPSQ